MEAHRRSCPSAPARLRLRRHKQRASAQGPIGIFAAFGFDGSSVPQPADISAAALSKEESQAMFDHLANPRALLRCLATAIFAGGVLALGAGAASAGQCPSDKVVASGSGQPMSDAAGKGVTDTVIASTDLGKEPVGVHDRLFRLRRLVIEPGGIVPWHSHSDRPAIIYIIEGEITEYASTCAVPIVHKAGESTAETHTTAHWWENTETKPVVLLSADLFHIKGNEHMM
jgi:quercetin dioxygenase-like cupin family protein